MFLKDENGKDRQTRLNEEFRSRSLSENDTWVAKQFTEQEDTLKVIDRPKGREITTDT